MKRIAFRVLLVMMVLLTTAQTALAGVPINAV
jgi:hypothetical protein